MEIESVKLSDIYPYYNNPRDNSNAVKPVMESIKKFGFIKPIIVDKTYTIIAGHTRYIAAYQLGIQHVPVVVSDMSDEKAKMFRIADNKLAEKSSFDEAKLIEELKAMDIPEEMQSFFFEDINSMINFTYGQFQQQAQDYGTDVSSEDLTGGFQDHFDDSDEEQATDEESEQEMDIFKVITREDGTKFMNVICPYCGNAETIEIE
jgi:hypothetical protein